MTNPRKVLVLGGNGFIGSSLVDRLISQGIPVRIFGRSHSGNAPGPHESHLLERVEGDFIHEGDVASALAGCDICFHLISTTLPKSSNDDPAYDVQTNVGGTLKLLNHAVKAGVKKIIFLSSGGTVYGTPQQIPIDESHPTNPICSYGISKLAIEKYLELFRTLYGLDYSILRLSNPYGEGQRLIATQGVIAVFINKVLKGEPIEIWGDGSVVRDYIHISDVSAALLRAMEPHGEQRLFNIGAGEGKSLIQVIDAIELVTGRSADCTFKPTRPFDVPISILSISMARELLRWAPQISFEKGLSQTAEWIKSRI